jgi:NADH-quinone oxidoreductase subunit H
MREAAQVVSYEVPMGLCVVIPVMICGTMDLVTIGNMQAGWGTNWLIFHDPFTFCTFWIYFTCATASVNRAPFDLAEAESELVAGFHTEYSGLRWSFFFMAEYGSMFAVSGLAAILFFGGWNGPIPITEFLGLRYEGASDAWSPAGYAGGLLGLINFMLKCVIGVTFMMWVRWTLPRLRIDQVMKVCLKYCTPLAAVMFLGAALWLLALPGGLVLKGLPLALVGERGAHRAPEAADTAPVDAAPADEAALEGEGDGSPAEESEPADESAPVEDAEPAEDGAPESEAASADRTGNGRAVRSVGGEAAAADLAAGGE